LARPKPYLKVFAPHKIVQHLADEIKRVLECDKWQCNAASPEQHKLPLGGELP